MRFPTRSDADNLIWLQPLGETIVRGQISTFDIRYSPLGRSRSFVPRDGFRGGRTMGVSRKERK